MRLFFLPAVGSVLALVALMLSVPGQAQTAATPNGKLRVLAVARTPLAGEDIPGGGLMVALLAAGLRQSGVADFAGVDLDVRWTKASPTPPLPRGSSIDIAVPVEGPDCDQPNDLTRALAVLCDNAVFSEPMLQVVVGLFVPKDGGFTFDSDEKIFGKTLCVAQDHDVSSLNGGGRGWVSLKRITLLRRQTLLDCVAAVQGRIAHAFVATDLEGRYLLGELGLTAAFRMQARPLATRGVHAVVARGNPQGPEIIEALNRGLERLKQSDLYATIVQRHLIKLWDGSADTPPPALAAPPAVPTPGPGAKASTLRVPASPAPEVAARVISPADSARARRFMERGDDELDDGRVAPARLLYERAADLGLGEAAMALAATYDAAELAKLNLENVRPDDAVARRWYERALSLGVTDARERLQRLGTTR